MSDDVIVTTKRVYEEIMEKADPRVAEWPLMDSPWPSFVICGLYLVLVKMGPTIMGDRKPFCLRNVLIVYNLGMVVLSTYIFIELCLSGWFTTYSYGCQPVDYSRSPQALRMANVCWMFYLSKFIELFDTIFFILRKKYNQVSFLHVFHHGIMPVSWWFGVKFVPGGFGTFHAMCNSFIHMVMYTYYGLSALGPAFQKYLWWKKYMTKMQITQFIIVCIHSGQLLFIDCNYPRIFSYVICLYAIIFLVMFAQFYVQAYRKGKSIEAKKSDQNGVSNGTVENGTTQKKRN